MRRHPLRLLGACFPLRKSSDLKSAHGCTPSPRVYPFEQLEFAINIEVGSCGVLVFTAAGGRNHHPSIFSFNPRAASTLLGQSYGNEEDILMHEKAEVLLDVLNRDEPVIFHAVSEYLARLEGPTPVFQASVLTLSNSEDAWPHAVSGNCGVQEGLDGNFHCDTEASMESVPLRRWRTAHVMPMLLKRAEHCTVHGARSPTWRGTLLSQRSVRSSRVQAATAAGYRDEPEELKAVVVVLKPWLQEKYAASAQTQAAKPPSTDSAANPFTEQAKGGCSSTNCIGPLYERPQQAPSCQSEGPVGFEPSAFSTQDRNPVPPLAENAPSDNKLQNVGLKLGPGHQPDPQVRASADSLDPDRLREAMVLSGLEPLVTALSLDGTEVLYQNMMSVRYYGKRHPATTAGGLGKPGTAAGTSSGSKSPTSDMHVVTQAGSVGSLLAELFVLEPAKLDRVATDVLIGGHVWKGLVQVPISCWPPDHLSLLVTASGGADPSSGGNPASVPFASAGGPTGAPSGFACVGSSQEWGRGQPRSTQSLGRHSAFSGGATHIEAGTLGYMLRGARLPHAAQDPSGSLESTAAVAEGLPGGLAPNAPQSSLPGSLLLTSTIPGDITGSILDSAACPRVGEEADPLATSTWGLLLDPPPAAQTTLTSLRRSIVSSLSERTRDGSTLVPGIDAVTEETSASEYKTHDFLKLTLGTSGVSREQGHTRRFKPPVLPSAVKLRQDQTASAQAAAASPVAAPAADSCPAHSAPVSPEGRRHKSGISRFLGLGQKTQALVIPDRKGTSSTRTERQASCPASGSQPQGSPSTSAPPGPELLLEGRRASVTATAHWGDGCQKAATGGTRQRPPPRRCASKIDLGLRSPSVPSAAASPSRMVVFAGSLGNAPSSVQRLLHHRAACSAAASSLTCGDRSVHVTEAHDRTPGVSTATNLFDPAPQTVGGERHSRRNGPRSRLVSVGNMDPCRLNSEVRDLFKQRVRPEASMGLPQECTRTSRSQSQHQGADCAAEEETEVLEGLPSVTTLANPSAPSVVNRLLQAGPAAGHGKSGAGSRGGGLNEERPVSPWAQAGPGSAEGGGAPAQPHCWHEVTATRVADPVTGKFAVVLTQVDVTAKVEAERHIALVSEAQHRLLEQIFPRHVMALLTEEGGPWGTRALMAAMASGHCGHTDAMIRDINRLATTHDQVTLLFADIKGFTPMCESLEPRVVMAFLNSLFTAFDRRLDEFGVYKVETIGDCYFVAGGLIQADEEGMAVVRARESHADPLHAEKVLMFAKYMLETASKVTLPTTGEPVRMRIGIHSGPVVSGVVGERMPRFCLFGDTVNTTSRMESTGVAGCIQASQAAYQLLRNETWTPTGGIEVKGKGLMNTYLWAPPDTHSQHILRNFVSSSAPMDSRGTRISSDYKMSHGNLLSGNITLQQFLCSSRGASDSENRRNRCGPSGNLAICSSTASLSMTGLPGQQSVVSE